jgi:hypothetical protein
MNCNSKWCSHHSFVVTTWQTPYLILILLYYNWLKANYQQSFILLTGFRLLPQYWGREKVVLFYGGVSPSKIGPIAPLLRDSTSPFKRTCLLIRVKEVPFGLYRRNGQC